MPGKHFLILDLDDSSLGRLERNILGPAGHAITRSSRTDRVQTGEYDLILLGDHGGGDILDRIEPLRQVHPASPIILFTQRNRAGTLTLQAIELGAFACLAIPIQVDEVMASVSRGLARRRELETWAERRAPRAPGDARTQLREIERAIRLGRSVATVLEPDAVLTAVVQAAVATTDAEEGRLMLVREDGDELELRATFHFEQDAARAVRLPVVDPLAEQVLASAEPILVEPEPPETAQTRHPPYPLAAVPLTAGERVIGVLAVENRERKRWGFNRGHLAALSALANFAAVAVENARLFAVAETERSKLEGTILTVADGVIVVDDTGRVELVNPRAREIFGLEDRDYRGEPIEAVLSFPELSAAIADQGQVGHRRFEFEPEEERHYLAQISPLPGFGKTVTIQDVSRFKELDALKNEFVTTISHDLRSPLTAILGYVELIGRIGETNEQQRDFIHRVQESVHSITELINALMELGRIEAGFDQQKEVVPLPVILRYAADGQRWAFDERDQEIALEIEEGIPPVFGSPVRLRQLINNLLENASKYSPPNGTVTLRARAEGDQVILEVCDNGIGIPAEDLPYVFDRLYRGGNVPIDKIGSGLGLSIVRSIVANHGGRLWCDSEEGKGTTVTVVLPTGT
ncbi:MAG TPA: ATP-binding protein [Anaerolineales bacterium]|nr:ATP-binding protein [Anaerolineales bacterium]